MQSPETLIDYDVQSPETHTVSTMESPEISGVYTTSSPDTPTDYTMQCPEIIQRLTRSQCRNGLSWMLSDEFSEEFVFPTIAPAPASCLSCYDPISSGEQYRRIKAEVISHTPLVIHSRCLQTWSIAIHNQLAFLRIGELKNFHEYWIYPLALSRDPQPTTISDPTTAPYEAVIREYLSILRTDARLGIKPTPRGQVPWLGSAWEVEHAEAPSWIVDLKTESEEEISNPLYIGRDWK